MKFNELKTSAKNNSVKDLEFSYYDDIDDALNKCFQNQDFISLLLRNDKIRNKCLEFSLMTFTRAYVTHKAKGW